MRIHKSVTWVSNRHFALELNEDDDPHVIDTSTNGTWLNNDRLEPRVKRKLKPGDSIQLAAEEFDGGSTAGSDHPHRQIVFEFEGARRDSASSQPPVAKHGLVAGTSSAVSPRMAPGRAAHGSSPQSAAAGLGGAPPAEVLAPLAGNTAPPAPRSADGAGVPVGAKRDREALPAPSQRKRGGGAGAVEEGEQEGDEVEEGEGGGADGAGDGEGKQGQEQENGDEVGGQPQPQPEQQQQPSPQPQPQPQPQPSPQPQPPPQPSPQPQPHALGSQATTWASPPLDSYVPSQGSQPPVPQAAQQSCQEQAPPQQQAPAPVHVQAQEQPRAKEPVPVSPEHAAPADAPASAEAPNRAEETDSRAPEGEADELREQLKEARRMLKSTGDSLSAVVAKATEFQQRAENSEGLVLQLEQDLQECRDTRDAMAAALCDLRQRITDATHGNCLEHSAAMEWATDHMQRRVDPDSNPAPG